MIRRAMASVFVALTILAASCGRSDAPHPVEANSVAAESASTEVPEHRPAPTSFDPAELATRSAGAFGLSGLSPIVMATLPGLYRLRNLDQCVVKFRHSVYLPEGWGYSTYTRTGHLLLLGEENGKTIGITTRCAMDFTYPGFQYVNANNPNPKFLVGVVALEKPGVAGKATYYDYHIVSEETPAFNATMTSPSEHFKQHFLGSLNMKPEFWPQVLESGDRVKYRTLGNNDLVFVEFDNLRMLGITSQPAAGGMQVVSVVSDSVAFRAGIKAGDVVEDVNGVRTRSQADLETAKASAPLNKEVKITVNRNGTRLTRYAVFHNAGNFLSTGSIASLGIDKPTEVVNQLLASLDQLGSMLSTKFYVHCEHCHERISRAKVEREPSLLETVARYIPLAGALLSMQPAAILTAMKLANRVNLALEVFQWLYDVVSKASDALAYLKNFPLGQPVIVLASEARVIDAGTIELNVPGKGPMRIQPAYCRSRDNGGAEYLRGLFRAGAARGAQLLALPDGKDLDGKTHCHLFLVGVAEAGVAGSATSRMDIYVNLMLIHEGYSSAQDYGISDGRSTRLVLEGFRKIDKFEK